MKTTDNLIKTRDDLKFNLEQIEAYLNDSDESILQDMKGYIRRGKDFVVYKYYGKYHFAPSRFVGYINNTLETHHENDNKHGWKTYSSITSVLGHKCYYNKKIEQLFIEYCEYLGIVPYNKKRMYWMFDGEIADFEEGSVRQITTNRYERSSEAREKCIEFHGTTCKVCGFNFQQVFGELGEGYIHVHHVVPIAERGGKYKINYETDLIPVCPNCHAMLHKGNLSVEELKKKINRH